MGNLPANFGVSRTFRSRLIGQRLSDASRDLATLTFDLWLLKWCALLPVFLGRFVLDLLVNTCQTRHVTLRPWTLILEVTTLVADVSCRSSCSIRVPSLKFVGLPVQKIMGIYSVSISRPGDLDLWPLTFWPLNWLTGYLCDGLPTCQIWAILGLSLLELCRGTRQTDRQTDYRWTALNL